MYNFFGVIVQIYKWALLFVFFYTTAAFCSQQPLRTSPVQVLLINPATYEKATVLLSPATTQAWSEFIFPFGKHLLYVSGMHKRSKDGGVQFTPTDIEIDREPRRARYPLCSGHSRTFVMVDEFDDMTDSEIKTLWACQKREIASKYQAQISQKS